MRQGGRCHRCGSDHGVGIHHRKYRSRLTKSDLQKGNGGGLDNAVGLCAQCHRDTHDEKPGTELYRIASWEPITPMEDEA
jgi:5-methylcytosine-specific restriction endonuclease McrA